MYKNLPFDDYSTVAFLGKKLNTRLKKKEQQDIINKWMEFGEKSNALHTDSLLVEHRSKIF